MKKYSKDFFFNDKGMLIKAIAVVIIAAAAFFVFVIDGENKDGILSSDEETLVAEEPKQEATIEKKRQVIVVDVGGAVKNPAVVELSADSRIGDAIEAAGGLSEDADISYINRAAFVNDGDKIYVPIIGEAPPSGTDSYADTGQAGSSIPGNGSLTGGKVNINSASSEELQTLNGVGPAIAAKIIDYRTNTGRFTKLEDLKNVNGIGEKTFEKMKDSIAI